MPIENQSQLSLAHTSCKACVFAEVEGTTQVGCRLGRLDRYRQLGGSDIIVEARDDDSEFFIVNGRLCPAKRGDRWLEREVGTTNLAMATQLEMDSAISKVEDELAPRLDIVIVLDEEAAEGGADGLIASLETSLAGVAAMSPKPAGLHIISDQDIVPLGRLHAELMSARELPCPWWLSQTVERANNGKRYGVWRAVDMFAGKFKGHFYSLYRAGSIPHPELAGRLRRAVVNRLESFSVLAPSSLGYDGLTVALGFHRKVQGNAPVSAGMFGGREDIGLFGVEEKALYLMVEAGISGLVRSLDTFLSE